jgi:hypothetical protein
MLLVQHWLITPSVDYEAWHMSKKLHGSLAPKKKRRTFSTMRITIS